MALESAPDFQLPTTAGDTVTLATFHGRPLVLAFFPLAFTGG
jgi:peroxiredoxin